MKTVTVKGKVYQLYVPYRIEGGYGDLHGHDEEDGFQLMNSGIPMTTSKIEVIESVGTITDAPIELEAGEWYMCKDVNENTVVLRYKMGSFYLEGNNPGFYPSEDVRPLYKMVKAS